MFFSKKHLPQCWSSSWWWPQESETWSSKFRGQNRSKPSGVFFHGQNKKRVVCFANWNISCYQMEKYIPFLEIYTNLKKCSFKAPIRKAPMTKSNQKNQFWGVQKLTLKFLKNGNRFTPLKVEDQGHVGALIGQAPSPHAAVLPQTCPLHRSQFGVFLAQTLNNK